jgi:hypothetical protein
MGQHLFTKTLIIFKLPSKCSSKSFAFFLKETKFCDVSQASTTSCILLLMFLSIRALEHARRVEDTFILAAVVACTVFAKGLANSRVAMKARSN